MQTFLTGDHPDAPFLANPTRSANMIRSSANAKTRIGWLLLALLLCALAWLAAPGSAWAQDAPPDNTDVVETEVADDATNKTFQRGPGSYFNPFLLAILWFLFLLWVKIVDWVSSDCQEHNIPYAKWVPIVAGPFFIGFLLTLLIPWFWVGASLSAISIVVPLAFYVRSRNEEVEPHEEVFTPEHLRFVASKVLGQLGIKIAAEAQEEHEKGAPVEFLVFGGDHDQGQTNLIRARQSPGYVTAKQIVADAVDARGEKIMLDFSAMAVNARHQIDGVWHDAESIDREEGDEMLVAIKTLANMNPEERKARQEGQVGAKYAGKKYFCSVVSQATKTGERVILNLADSKGNQFSKLEDTGMREPVIELLKAHMLKENGVLLFSAMPGGGLTTTFTAAINSTDRLLRDFVSIEPHDHRMPEVENVDPVIIQADETIAQRLPSILRKDADVIVVPHLTDQESVTAILKSAKDRLTFTEIPSKDAIEAMLRVLMMKVPIKDFASVISLAVNQRLIRKLCEDCKEGYKPPAALLQKLRLPPGRIDQFYKPPTPNPEDKEICETCSGIGYFGRMAIYEVIEVKDNLRKTLLTQPKMDALRQAARADGNRTLQEEGILAVVQGKTSLPEIQRILKQ